jgi:hypothetical protein
MQDCIRENVEHLFTAANRNCGRGPVAAVDDARRSAQRASRRHRTAQADLYALGKVPCMQPEKDRQEFPRCLPMPLRA